MAHSMTLSTTLAPPALDELCGSGLRRDPFLEIAIAGQDIRQLRAALDRDVIVHAGHLRLDKLIVLYAENIATKGHFRENARIPHQVKYGKSLTCQHQSNRTFFPLSADAKDCHRDSVLPRRMPVLVIETGISLGWRSYVGPQIPVIGVDRFGASAPGPVVMQHHSFTVENVCRQAHTVLEQAKRKS
jgi:hypothetical protein